MKCYGIGRLYVNSDSGHKRIGEGAGCWHSTKPARHIWQDWVSREVNDLRLSVPQTEKQRRWERERDGSEYVPSLYWVPASPLSSYCPVWTSSGSACWTYQNWRNAGLVWVPWKSRITKTTVTMMEKGGEEEEEGEGLGVRRVWKWTGKTNKNTLNACSFQEPDCMPQTTTARQRTPLKSFQDKIQS